MSDLLGDPEHEGTNDLVFSSSKELLNNHQENLETNKFPRVSLEQIPDVISEMVEITSKNVEEENVDTNSPSQATVTESQENNCSTEKESNQIDNQIPEKELPERRRSNRIRRLVVKPDGFVKRSSGTKKTKDNKSTDKVINLQLIPTPPSTDTENIKNDGDKISFPSDANSSSKDEQPEDVELQNLSKKTQVGKNNKKSLSGTGRKLKSEAKKSTFSKKKLDKSNSEASEKITSKEESEVAASLNTNLSAENSDKKSSLPRSVSEKKAKSEVKKITSRRKKLDKTSSENPSIETTCKEEVVKTSDPDNNNSESGITKETVPEVKTEKKIRSQTKKNNSRRKKQDASTSENAPDEPVSKEDISKSVDSDNCSAETVEEKHLLSPQTLATSCAKVLDSSEIKVPEAISTFAKNILDPNSEIIENSNVKPVKVKSRWWRSSELEGVLNSDSLISPNDQTATTSNVMQESPNNPENDSESAGVNEEAENIQMDIQQPSIADDSIKDDNTTKQLNYPVYCHIEENIYRFARKKSKSKKQVRRMVCDCTLTKEEQEYGVLGCKEECLNRLLMIECGSRCPIGEACSNKKFQKKQYVKAEIFHAEKKGWGLRTLEDISVGDFLMEFVGEVLNHKEYRQRVKQYAKEKNVHSYFMALKTDEILDATSKGNLTRFINHSCDPNCETQKWTVNGELRVGVFAKRSMSAGEELTLDYQFQRYGREAQKCYCGSDKCSGYIGGAKQISIDAYGANKSGTSRRKKGSDDKKREWEDLTLEEEIEKLNGSKGLRNKEETLKLARLMVRADDPVTRHQLLDIIIKTEEQACLRLFLDYHGLPLMWSWMADNVGLDLKAKILQVLALLPISNKTMLRDSKVMSVVEKWLQECSGSKSSVSAISTDCSALNPVTEENSEPISKKLKVDFSDCETDSSGSQKVDDNPSDSTPSIIENVVSPDGETQSEPSKENNSADAQQTECTVSEDDRSSGLKMNISNMATELLSNWKNLKELFRIPRLEQQKRREDELEADHKVIPELPPEIKIPMAEPAGDQIQVVISGKICNFSENVKSFDYQDSNVKLEDNPRKAGRSNPLFPLPKLPNRHFMKRGVDKAGPRKLREDSPSGSVTPLFPANIPLPGAQVSTRPPLLPSPNIFEPSHFNFPPPVNPPATPLQHLDPAPQVMFSPQMVYPQPQVPFMGPTPTSGMPPPTTAVPPPTLSLPSLLQTPPPNVGMPPCQPLNPNLPPNPSNYLLPPNMQPASVVPSSSQFIPGQTSTVSNYPQNANPFGNQNPPFYYIQQPPPLSNSGPPVSYTENVPVQTTAASLPVQTTNALPVQTTTSVTVQLPAPAAKEEPKPVKLPKNWRTATDSEGNVYYYHSITRQTQWDPPDENQVEEDSADEDSDSEESESSDTPTYDEPKVVSVKRSKRKSKKRKTTKTSPDTSVAFPVRPEIAKKIKELFRTKMSSFIVHCLNAYRKPDCTVGRITSNEDFKYLARKLTHYTMTKELKQCKNVEDLDCNETVMHKAKDFIKKYMAKYGSQYCRKERASPTEE